MCVSVQGHSLGNREILNWPISVNNVFVIREEYKGKMAMMKLIKTKVSY